MQIISSHCLLNTDSRKSKPTMTLSYTGLIYLSKVGLTSPLTQILYLSITGPRFFLLSVLKRSILKPPPITKYLEIGSDNSDRSFVVLSRNRI